MSIYADDPDDVNCDGFVSGLRVADMPRIPIDRQGLRAAAETIARFETATVARDALAHGDPRLAPFLREAMARQKEYAA